MDIQILPTISTSFIVISAIFIAIGWYQIKQRRIALHQKLMFIGGIFALGFFLIYASRTVFLGNTSFGGPDHIKTYYTIFLVFHIVLATSGGVFGLVSLISGFKNKLKLHRKIGPITSVVWFFTAITGTIVYLLLYIMYPGGETTSLIKAIWGL